VVAEISEQTTQIRGKKSLNLL